MSGIGGILGGGNILGSLLNVASMFFPPLQMAGALFNMLGSAVGQAINGALNQLQQESGLPKFIGDAVKQALQEALGGSQQATDPAAQQQVNEQFGDQMKQFVENLVRQVVEDVKQERENQAGEGAGAASGKGGWLVALATAFGKIADKAAAELESAGKNLNNENPSEMIEYQAKAQEFSQMMNTFTNAIKTIGEANANTVRKG
jgi:hypothetical protein